MRAIIAGLARVPSGYGRIACALHSLRTRIFAIMIEAERLNQISNQITDLAARNDEIRRYL